MKIKNLLLGTTGLLLAVSMNATDYEPVNWRFSEMEVGSAEGIFLKEMASTNWNCKAPFRLADNGQGGVGLSCHYDGNGDIVGPVSDTYEGVSDADKETFEDFYKNAYIVDGGSENLLCLIGKNATATYPGASAREKSFPNATLFWLSGNENSETVMPLASYYRLTIDYRVITPEENSKIDLTIATSHYDGIDQASGLASGGYRTFSLGVYSAFNDYWNRGIMDFYVEDNTDASYQELPIVIKMWLGSLADNSVILFRSFKLEKIDEYNEDYVPGNNNEDPGFKDTPTTALSQYKTDDLVVWGANGMISVVDAKEPIEVYNPAGLLLSRVEEVSTLVNIPVNQKGMFIVKVGSVSRKIIL